MFQRNFVFGGESECCYNWILSRPDKQNLKSRVEIFTMWPKQNFLWKKTVHMTSYTSPKVWFVNWLTVLIFINLYVRLDLILDSTCVILIFIWNRLKFKSFDVCFVFICPTYLDVIYTLIIIIILYPVHYYFNQYVKCIQNYCVYYYWLYTWVKSFIRVI